MVAPNGQTVTGYATAYDSAGYPDMIPHVWWEGTFGVAYALGKLGDDTRKQEVLAEAYPGRNDDGSFPYVSTHDTTYELVPYGSAVGAAWAVLAEVGAGVFDTGAMQTITRG